MKRMLVLLLALMLIIPLASCGEPEKDHSDLYGTWKVSYIESDGSKFSVEEWEELEYTDYSKNIIVIKEGGKAGVVDEYFSDVVEWLAVGDTIMIDDEKYKIEGDVLKVEEYDAYLCYEKTSDSQTIPKVENDEDEEYYDDEESIEDEETDVESETDVDDSAEWKEFLVEYEEWVDEYIAVVKKYKENPSDLSILTEYTSLVSELADWTSEADDISDSIVDTDDAAEFSAELIRIAAKISEVAGDL